MDKIMKLAEENTDLPTNIIETILTFLPIRNAVRTTILSRRWRYLWASIPKLVFDDTLCQTAAGNQEHDQAKLVFIVYKVLLLHRGPINEFTLSISELESCSEIDQLILFLSRKNTLEKFTLCIWKGEPYTVPSSLFSCQNLTHLKLHSCVLVLPPMIGGFSSLISLEFYEVIFTANVLGNFISNCPLLEKISLISSGSFDCLEIDAPKLRFLDFQLELKTLLLKNITLLVNVSICLKVVCVAEEYSGTSNLIQFFDRLPLVENLCIAYQFVKCLAAGGVPHKLPTSLVHLKFLELLEISLRELDEVSFALCLIRSSPNLEKITLVMSSVIPKVNASVLETLQAQDFSEVILNQLRLVKIECFSGMHPELEIVKLLLAKSPNLEQMLIEPHLRNVTDKGLQMLKDLIQFERASPKAKVVFSDSPST